MFVTGLTVFLANYFEEPSHANLFFGGLMNSRCCQLCSGFHVFWLNQFYRGLVSHKIQENGSQLGNGSQCQWIAT